MAKRSFEKAQEIFNRHQGILRTSQVKKLGINEATQSTGLSCTSAGDFNPGLDL